MSRFNQPEFNDLLFRQKRKQDEYRVIEAPVLVAGAADTHAHLQLLPNPALALARCAAHKVSFMCTIVDIVEDDPAVFSLIEGWRSEACLLLKDLMEGDSEKCFPPVPRIRIAVGCHPHNAKDFDAAAEARLWERLKDLRVGALGEIGLDYHYDFSPRDQQKEVFRRQLRIANKAGLPVILHLREAHDEALEIMQEEGFPQAGCLLHCFNLDWSVLQPWVDAGCFIAFGGPLTFKSTHEVRAAAARVPLNRLLTETDAPYMTPEPLRGMMCGPEHVIFTAECMAQVRGSQSDPERKELLDQMMNNALGLLDRQPTEWQRSFV